MISRGAGIFVRLFPWSHHDLEDTDSLRFRGTGVGCEVYKLSKGQQFDDPFGQNHACLAIIPITGAFLLRGEPRTMKSSPHGDIIYYWVAQTSFSSSSLIPTGDINFPLPVASEGVRLQFPAGR